MLGHHIIVPIEPLLGCCYKCWHNLCNEDHPINVLLCCDIHGSGCLNTSDWKRLIALLSVCQQIYHETKVLPYSLGVFNIQDDKTFEDWVLALQPDQRSAITTLQIDGSTSIGAFRNKRGQYLMDLVPNLSILQCDANLLKRRERGCKHIREQNWIREYVNGRGLKMVLAQEVCK